ncbi:unnamed protein product [Sphagnum tenellum]
MNVEILPLTTVNLLQNVPSGTLEQEATDRTKEVACGSLETDGGRTSLSDSEGASDTVSDTDTETDSTFEPQLVDVLDEAIEFGNTEFEELVLKEGPEQILQLTLQDQTDQFMREEISDSDDCADWIQWVSDAEERKTGNRESTMCEKAPVLMKMQRPNEDENLHNPVKSSECSDENTRWREISQRIQIEPDLGEERLGQLWKILGNYQDVFAWNKRELGCCTIGEHNIDTQGFPPCNMTPGRLSFWEETEVKRQIDELVDLGKTKPSNSEYACRGRYTARSWENPGSAELFNTKERDECKDFSFKIMHRPGLKHANADALSRNPVGSATDDDDFDQGIQDVTTNVPGEDEELLYIRRRERTEWMGMKRKDRRYVQHDACCFNINHTLSVRPHHLYMIDTTAGEDSTEQSTPAGESITRQDEPMQQTGMRTRTGRKRTQYLDRHQQLELALAAQELSEKGNPGSSLTGSDEED